MMTERSTQPIAPLTRPQRFPWLLAGSLFLLAYGVSLLTPAALYWDDWTLVGVRPAVILANFRASGSVFNLAGYLHVVMLMLGPWAYHLLTFLGMFSAGVMLWSILATVAFIRPLDRNLIVLLFLTLPFNTTRVSLIIFPTVVCYAAFFCAWHLLVSATAPHGKIPAFVLFFVSFVGVPSFLVFYLLPVLHWISRTDWRRAPRRSTLLFAAGLFLVPLAYRVVQVSIFKPYGAYAGYNQVDLASVRHALPWLVVGLIYTVTAMAVVPRIASDRLKALCLIPVGVWILELGLFPYVAVGKVTFFPMPAIKDWYNVTFFDWNSRFLTLMPLGVAATIVAIDRVVRIGRFPLVAAAALAVSVAYNIEVGLEYRVDWIKQREVIALLRDSDAVRRARTVVVYDKAPAFSARLRDYRFYEFNGWLKRAFGDETRFAVEYRAFDYNPARLTETLSSNYAAAFTEIYSASQYVRGKPDVLVEMDATEDWWTVLRTGHGFALKVSPVPPK